MLDHDGRLTKGLTHQLHEAWTEKDYKDCPDAKTEHEQLYKDYTNWQKQK